jgi:type II secretion system protein J
MNLPPSTINSRPSRLFRGFTLVEILIAMAILAMVLAAIYSTWTAILRASKVGKDAAAAVQRARMAGRTIEEALGSTLSFIQNQVYYAFVAKNGSEASLSFVTRLSPSFPRAGKFSGLDVRRVTFSVEQASGGARQLVLRQTPLLMDLDPDEKNRPVVLATNVKEFKSEFWDPRLEDWIDEWKQTNRLPIMVKVTIKLADSQFSTQVREQITRIVSLPAVAVQPIWQMPRNLPVPGVPGNPALPNQPNPAVPNPNQPNLNPGFLQNPGR